MYPNYTSTNITITRPRGQLVLACIIVVLVTSTSAGAVDLAGGAMWGNSGVPPLALGAASKETCFLTGVEGSLKGGAETLDNTIASVSVYINAADDTWYIKTLPGHGSGVMARVRCIRHVGNRQTLTWSAADGLYQPYSFVPATPNRHCFLTGVSATTGFTGVYNGQKTFVNVRNDGVYWRLTGYLEPRQDGSGGGRATAMCVDISHYWSGTGTWYGPNPGSSQTLIGISSGKMGCFLTGISGNYYHSPPAFAWEDGVRIFQHDPNEPKIDWFFDKPQTDWYVRSRSGKGAYVLCVE